MANFWTARRKRNSQRETYCVNCHERRQLRPAGREALELLEKKQGWFCPYDHFVEDSSPLYRAAALMSRRNALKVIGTVTAAVALEVTGNVFDEELRKILGAVQEQLRQEPENSATPSIELNAKKIFQDMFGLSDEIKSFHLGPKGYLMRHRWNLFSRKSYHPDHKATFEVLSKMFGLADGEISFKDKITDVGDIISIGGSSSTPLTKIAFQYEGPSDAELNRPDKPIIPLTYFGLADRRKIKGWGGIRMQDVGPVLAPLWPVICTDPNKPWGGELTPGVNNLKKIEVYHEGRIESVPMLSDNYLVVTKLPNFLSLDFADILKKDCDVITWPSMLVFDGMNGIGTRAVELLTQSAGLKQLEHIKDGVTHLPAFQLLFKVSDFEPTDEGFHKANTIELIDTPVPIDPDPAIYQKAHEYAMSRLKME